ncbi:GNAT family N-acetyltransferase [Actinoplanes couchii]|uniref:N-acetyltransferase n=1 Tax=Actinoplanes couchii TaxID=403638 RepID=A0ABQ3XCF6_9ACTN|nr:GNAT family N-acetyltransferase [Actinoplanes couchii]MDR6323688.1 GNAT superfamily N-acetyltransferase [Actinoplanes couchii]GID56203.1 N-acetyltransferase [Actinoplanes couchii]
MEDLERDGYVLSADPKRVDFARVHRWLSEESYWAAGRPYDLVARSIDGSVPYSVFTSPTASTDPAQPAEQVAFARAVTDGATFAWICDVFVDADHRGHGLGKWMIDTILADLSERGIQRFLLATRDAHDVYRRSGFTELVGANRYMEIDHRPTRNAILGLP